MIISIIVAVADNWVIGKKNSLPWYLPADLKHFKETTMGHAVIMGQNTHESIGKVLPGRKNIIVTFDKDFKVNGAEVAYTIEEALRIAQKSGDDEVFIIGGASIYRQFLAIANKVYLTRIHYNFDGDVTFPKLDNSWEMVSCEKHESDVKNPYPYEYCIFEKKLS